MKKILLITSVTLGLSACELTSASAEESSLKAVYSACIHRAEGHLDKVRECQSVLDVLRQKKQHTAFVEKETVNVRDYQECIQARKHGDDNAAEIRCGKIWQDIRANNR